MGRRRLTDSERRRVETVLTTNRVFFTAIARKFTRRPDEVPDVLQRARLDVARGLRGFRRDSNVTTWLHQVVANAARMQNRTEGRHRGKMTRYHDAVDVGIVPTTTEGHDLVLERRERYSQLVRNLEAQVATGIISTNREVRAEARRIREVLDGLDPVE